MIKVSPNSTLFLESIRIENGRAEFGAGILNYGTLVMLDGALMSFNIATEAGGGVYNSGPDSILSMQGGSFNTNDAVYDGNGGGAYIENGSKFLGVSGTMINNKAGGNGGAIYTPYTNLANININAGFRFGSNNAAYVVYLAAPADIALYNEHVKSTSMSFNSAYSYNNIDIAYPYISPTVRASKSTASGAPVPDGVFTFVLKYGDTVVATATNKLLAFHLRHTRHIHAHPIGNRRRRWLENGRARLFSPGRCL